MTDRCSMWFSPTAVGDLFRRSHSAADELRQLLRGCTDAQASSALRAALADLEFEILPALDRLCTSTALTEWNRTMPGENRGHRRSPPMTPARRAAELLSILDELSGDDTAATTAASSLTRLIERHPTAARQLINLDNSRYWDRLITRIGHSITPARPNRSLIDSLVRLAAAAIDASSDEDSRAVISSLALSATVSPQAGAVIADLALAMSDESLTRTIKEVIDAPRPQPTLGPTPAAGRRIALEGILTVAAGRPSTAAAILSDLEVFNAVVTDRALDADTVTEALLAAMGELSPPVVLADLVAVGPTDLSDGAARAAATAVASSIDALSRTIDAPLVRTTGPDGPVDIADADAMGELMSRLMDDEQSLVILGVAVGGMREQRLERAISGTAHMSLDLAEVIAAQLADVEAVINAMTAGAADADVADQARRASMLSGSRSAILLLGQLALLAAPGARLVIGGVTTTARELIDLVIAVPDPVPTRETLTDQLAMSLRVGLLSVIIARPSLWPSLGLSTVAAHIWDEVADHVRRFNMAATDRDRARSHADLMVVIGDSLELSTVANSIRALADR